MYIILFFFFNDTATTEIYTLSLHDALPISFLSVPVLYAAPGARGKPIGVINLTDRVGGDAFTAGDRKLVAAIANQIGAAIENARLVARDLGQQRVLRELELARDLQLKLLPSPLVVASRVDVAARCRQAESVRSEEHTSELQSRL